MNCIEFNDISFTYPAVEGDLDAEGKQIVPQPVFDHFSGAIPGGFVSLIGPNGAGKSTFMLLASGRLLPDHGKVMLLGQDVAALPQEQKNLLASVIYQNMEFESEATVAELLAQVYANGALEANACPIYSGNDNCPGNDMASKDGATGKNGKDGADGKNSKNGKSSPKNLLEEVIQVFELEKVLNHGLMELSKGEIQRVLLAFSILYGSATVFMDEPLFAMEQKQKEAALTYLKDFCAKTGTTIYISMHELDLTRRYAQNVLLFYPNRDMDFGTPEEILTDQALEKAYGVPAAMLKDQESFNRESLQNTADAVLKVQQSTK